MASTFLELDGKEIIATSLIIKELNFDQEIADIITQVFTNFKDIGRFKIPNIEFADQWDIGDLYNKPILLKMAGYCGGGTSDSYWSIYLSGIGCLIFDDPSNISENCNLFFWDNDEGIFNWNSNSAENNALAKIKSLSDSNKNVDEIKHEFEKYQEFEDDLLFVKSNFREIADKIKLNPELKNLKQDNEYIFDLDNSFDYDILSEISQIWPLKGLF